MGKPQAEEEVAWSFGASPVRGDGDESGGGNRRKESQGRLRKKRGAWHWEFVAGKGVETDTGATGRFEDRGLSQL